MKIKNLVKNEYASDALHTAIMYKLNNTKDSKHFINAINAFARKYVDMNCNADLVVDDKQINALAKKHSKAKLAEHSIISEREFSLLFRLITELAFEFECYKAEAKQVESNLRAELFDLHNEFDAYVIEAEADADDKRFATTSC